MQVLRESQRGKRLSGEMPFARLLSSCLYILLRSSVIVGSHALKRHHERPNSCFRDLCPILKLRFGHKPGLRYWRTVQVYMHACILVFFIRASALACLDEVLGHQKRTAHLNHDLTGAKTDEATGETPDWWVHSVACMYIVCLHLGRDPDEPMTGTCLGISNADINSETMTPGHR